MIFTYCNGNHNSLGQSLMPLVGLADQHSELPSTTYNVSVCYILILTNRALPKQHAQIKGAISY